MGDGNRFRDRLRQWFDELISTAVVASPFLAQALEEATPCSRDGREFPRQNVSGLPPIGADQIDVDAALRGILGRLGEYLANAQ